MTDREFFNHLAAHYTIHAVEKKSHEAVEVNIMAMYHMEEGKIAKIISFSDSGLAKQFK